MRNMGRALAAIVIAGLVIGLGACSSSKKNGAGSGTQGGGPFGNAPTSGSTTAGHAGAGSGSGATGTGTGSGCAEGRAQASRVVPRVVLLVDGSCSMSSNYPSTGRDATQCMQNPNGRWAAIRKALVDPQAGVVTQLQSAVQFGLAIFGTQPQCPITGTPIPPGINALNAITMAMPDVQPGMFTPTGAALDWTYQNMFQPAPTGPDQQAQGPSILILATDGEPNDCTLGAGGLSTNFQPSIDAVTRGAMMGIKTYVISLAASSGQFHDFLQQLANIGSMSSAGKLYEPTNPADLEADLQLLIGGAIGCDIALNGSVMMGRECEGKVTLNGAPVTCNSPDGWILADPRHIRLQGKACDTLKSTKDALVDALFPCGVFSVQ